MNSDIDFVLLWVNNKDPLWKREMQKYSSKSISYANNKNNYRDWDNLQYLFRAFEYFTPWVNKIHFVTYGHVPSWLNINNPKLSIVKHSDFLEDYNLPVFNSRAIEVNLHKIPNLSEKFVYFNDDFFILEKLSPNAFFKNNLPIDVCISDIMHEGEIAHTIVNNIDIINKHHNRHINTNLTKRSIILNNFTKWFSIKYGKYVLNTLLLLKWKTFTGFLTNHHPQPYLKSTFIELWRLEKNILNLTSSSKFKDSKDVNQYLFRYWQLVKGNFIPDNYKNVFLKRKYVNLRSMNDVESAANDIKSRRYQFYCPNDTLEKSRFTKRSITEEEFEIAKKLIKDSLHTILPNKSSYEV